MSSDPEMHGSAAIQEFGFFGNGLGEELAWKASWAQTDMERDSCPLATFLIDYQAFFKTLLFRVKSLMELVWDQGTCTGKEGQCKCTTVA